MMGCSKNTGYSGIQQKKSGEIYRRPVPSQFKPMQIPEPTEVVCIKTEKIYESCESVETNEQITDLCEIAVGEIEDVWCIDVEMVSDKKHPFHCEKIPNTNRAKISFWYRFRFAYVDQSGQKFYSSRPVFFEKMVILSDQIFDKRLHLQCDVFLDCFECFVSASQQVTCCIGKLLLIRLVAMVQLLVPAYGFCDEPESCTEVEAGCPGFEPVWPPFPPQPVNSNNNNDDGDNGDG